MVNADLLNGLPPAEAARVMALGKRMLMTAGAELFHLGDDAECIYLVLRGRVRLTLPMQVRNREEDVLVEERSSGQTVGWSALTPPYRFTLTAAVQLETEVIAFPREALHAYFAEHADTGYVVSRNLANIIGNRLQLFQAMWLREIQRMVELRCA
jgi:CRP-like cAMP-binding protein